MELIKKIMLNKEQLLESIRNEKHTINNGVQVYQDCTIEHVLFKFCKLSLTLFNRAERNADNISMSGEIGYLTADRKKLIVQTFDCKVPACIADCPISELIKIKCIYE